MEIETFQDIRPIHIVSQFEDNQTKTPDTLEMTETQNMSHA